MELYEELSGQVLKSYENEPFQHLLQMQPLLLKQQPLETVQSL
jgi:hypothetical protein